MKNWLGQEIEVGSLVYRGARSGNYSSFKIGRVKKVMNEKATVEWAAEPSTQAFTCQQHDHPELRHNTWRKEVCYLDVPRKMKSSGSPTIDSLCLIDAEVYERVLNDATVISDYLSLTGRPKIDCPEDFKGEIDNHALRMGRKEVFA